MFIAIVFTVVIIQFLAATMAAVILAIKALNCNTIIANPMITLSQLNNAHNNKNPATKGINNSKWDIIVAKNVTIGPNIPLIKKPNTPPKTVEMNSVMIDIKLNKGSNAVKMAAIKVATCPKIGTKMFTSGSIAA